MNTGQVLLIIGALTLLSVVSLSVRTLVLNTTVTYIQSEAQLTGVSVAQSMLDEIMSQEYDSSTTQGKRIWDSTKFTQPTRLGPETSPGINEITSVTIPESPDTVTSFFSVRKYNDVDDYNNYKRYYYSSALGLFAVVDSVYYVQELNPDQRSTNPTYFKKIVVTVRHPNLCIEGSYNPWQGRYYVQLSNVAVYRRYF
jgi:hypothetical protein